jgi:Fis family transcriptional regulator
LYELILSQVEKPLFESVLKNTRGNLSKAAQVLGMNRGTLRTRLKKYGLEP